MTEDREVSIRGGVADPKSDEMSGVLQKVRGVGFEPTKAYATGSLIPRRILSVARLDSRPAPLT